MQETAFSATPSLAPRHLRVRGLAVRRGERLLFAGLDFELAPGQGLVLKGPNGAGKSSLLLALAGLLRPEAGQITVSAPAGADVADDEPQTAVHFVGHLPALKARLTARENLAFWTRMLGGHTSAIDGALDRVGLGAAADIDAGYLSAGQTRRLALARLLVAARPVWLLDEPTSALDSAGEALVAGLIDAHLDAGGVLVVATHRPLNLAGDMARVRTLTLSGAEAAA